MYNSEHYQDFWLAKNVFVNQDDGVFVEVGALDGVQHSNSLYFEKHRGWSGICIEANPYIFAQLTLNRQCACVHAAVAPEDGEVDFEVMQGGLYGWSGISKFIEPQHRERIEANIPEERRDTIKVPAKKLNNILSESGIKEVDYMSIDIEGAEYPVLSTFDFSKVSIRVLDIENNFGNDKIEALLKTKGYSKVRRLGVNDIYM